MHAVILKRLLFAVTFEYLHTDLQAALLDHFIRCEASIIFLERCLVRGVYDLKYSSRKMAWFRHESSCGENRVMHSHFCGVQ